MYIPIVARGLRPSLESWLAGLQLLAMVITISGLCWAGFARIIFYTWLLPGRIAVGSLAFSFDYLPHRPGTHGSSPILRSVSPVQATCVTSLVGDFTSILTWPLMQQNYHNIHHFWPFVPFYCYATIWKSTKADLIAMGTAVIPILGT